MGHVTTEAAPAVDRAFLSDLFDELFPIPRSITGPGLRESLEIFRRHMPLEIEQVASGTKVFDWTVPPEWRLTSAVLTGPDGTVVADAAVSNLHVLNYSTPIDARLSLAELQPHLHSIPDLPDAVPYATSYYTKNWGFCLADRVRQALPEGTYHAKIDTRFVAGGVDFGHCTLPGESTAEILLSSYLCHPSLANNELSGPLVLLGLFDRLSRWPRRRFTYRFVLNPETIGSLCYLHRHAHHLREHVVAGLVLTCVGGPEERLSYKTSRPGDSVLDALVARAWEGRWERRPYTPTGGSDERQYGSPGFKFPIGQVARTIYGQYAGYHNSLDDKAFMDLDRIVASIDEIEAFLKEGELAGCFRNTSPYGEPQLGRRDLYPNVNVEATRTDSTDEIFDARATLNRVLNVLNYSDGEHSMLDIAATCECTLSDLAPVIERLENVGLLVHEPHPGRS